MTSLATVAICLPATATAGTYRVLACDAAPRSVNNAWREHEDRGMRAGASCPTRGDDRRGLSVGNRVNAGLVRSGKGASMTFSAPAGASLRGVALDWDGRRTNGEWLLGLVRGDGRLVAGCAPDRRSPRDRCRLGDPKGVARITRDLGGHRSVRIEATCAMRRGCGTDARSGPDRTRARLAAHEAAVVVADGSAPNVTAAGAMISGGWKRGTVDATVRAADNVGIRSTDLRVGASVREAELESCDFTRPVPCPAAAQRTYRLDTRDLADGRHAVALAATDAARNDRSVERVVAVDNHAPGAVRDVRLLGGDRVRSTNSFDLRWTPPPGQAAPIARAHYRLCPESAPSQCTQGTRPGGATGIDDLAVPSRGSWRLRVWLEDAAGNSEQARASAPVTLRFDDRTPTRLGVGAFTPDGTATRRATVGFGARAELRGSLSSNGGERLAREQLSVLTRARGAERFRRVGATSTDSSGAFRHRLPPGPSRTVRVAFAGSQEHRPTTASVHVAVRAKSSMAVSRHRVRNGGRVHFHGRLRGGSIPRDGKLLQLEAFYRDRWRTFAVVRSSPRGAWRYRYRFEATTGRVRYPFRVRVPRERDYPFAVGHSRVVRVTVNGL